MAAPNGQVEWPQLDSEDAYRVLYFQLTGRQVKFVCAFLANGGNATAAYQDAYDVADAAQAAADASALLKNPKISQVVASAKAAAFAAAFDRYQVTAADVVRGLAQVARADIRDVVTVDEHGDPQVRPTGEWTGDAAMAVAGIKVTPGKYGATISVQMDGRVQALTALAKHFGLLLDRSAVTQVAPGEAVESPAAELLARLGQLSARGGGGSEIG